MLNICVVGRGNMGSAIIDLLSAGERAKKLYTVSGIGRGEEMNGELEESEVVILAVKPQDFFNFAHGVRMNMSGKLVISIMAGVSVAKICSELGAKKVVRTMPNLALKEGISFTGWFAGSGVSKEDRVLVREILALMGEEMEVKKEEDLNYITALSGCGPAYFYYVAEMLEKAAVKKGLSAEVAAKMSRTTLLGAAKYMESEDCGAAELRARVSSKGGCTEAAVKALEGRGVEAAFMEAFEKAEKRSRELSD